MKKIILLALTLSLSVIAKSQAPVPFTWDFPNTTLPAGFTMGTTPGGATYAPGFYASNGNVAAPSFKLSGTGHFLKIHIAAQAGVVSYFLKGQNVGGAAYQGTIDIEFSDDDTTWTSARTLTNTDISTSSYTKFNDTCKSTTRFIRFFYTTKVSGVNLSLDDIEIGSPLPKPEAEINAVIDNDTIFSGSKFYTSENIASTKRINIIIENHGTDSTLRINSVTSSNPTQFSVSSFPDSVIKLSTDTIKIDFSPLSIGTIKSTLTINNNDSNENPYIINLVGYGNGTATEPNSPDSVFFTNVSTYKYTTHFSHSSPRLEDESFLVLFKQGTPPVGVPSDGVEYSAGESIGNAKVAYVGKDSTYFSKETIANSTFHIAVYSYSGFGTYSNYNPIPKTQSVTTPATMQNPSYYSGISTASTTFVADLNAKINPHTLAFYSDYDDTYIKEFAVRDTTNGMQVVTCAYSSDNYIFTPPFNFSYISREHSFPQSWMPTYGDKTLPEYNDYHNLYPVNQNDANAVRSNKPLGEVVTIITSFKDGTYGKDSAGNAVYEPRDSHKGNAARAIFYMSAAYTSVSGNTWNLPNPIDPLFLKYGQNQDVLKKWHWQDPVDNEEIARNDYIETVQNNRNPFIDSMNFVCFIDFTTMSKVNTASPCTSTPVGLDDNNNIINLTTYPNPTTNIINIAFNLKKAEKMNVTILNTLGQNIQTTAIEGLKSGVKSMDATNLTSGIYVVTIESKSFTKNIKIVKK